MAGRHNVALPEQANGYLPAAMGAALLIAIVALIVALRKRAVIQDVYTKYKRRAPPSTSSSSYSPSREGPWSLRGHDSKGRSIALKVDPKQLNKGPLIIGRNSSHSQLLIDDSTVSRQHAQLSLSSGRLQVIDLDSSNGTLVDSKPVGTEPISLQTGQTLTLGKVVLNIDLGEL